MFRLFGNSNDEFNGQPDLTNLIDPMVLLSGLMILMLPTMQVLQQQDVSLPTANGSNVQTSETPPMVVGFNAAGELTWNGNPVTKRELQELLSQLAPGSSVLVAGDERAEFGHGFETMALINAAGHSCRGLTLKEGNQ